ncbi:YkgJ family cysteine cluster protein [Acidithiobacillus ferrooxidans]|uniref:YkgJ family cysteine cluster protein n=1 Tax=Acidithiobacillus ferrooxidans TaxID=920 RepID=UPI001D015927|nr:YkgJ family cysteine cluster protein [Acidithiobacillus ferrooxidans]
MNINRCLQERSRRQDVPCGSCHLCCKNMLIVVSPSMGDDVSQFAAAVPMPEMPGFFRIPEQENGDCYYLGAHGCTIHDHAPAMCQFFSCIGAVRGLTPKKAAEGIANNRLAPAVLKRGRALLREQMASRSKKRRTG